ncbi:MULTISPECIES: 3-ketoacyl-ACP reductase [unclassified Variovorax]|uniref:3-ketoacyl-ACP reductase n=1 Tax=unclassified Variovorax TaxID=663243 RepID=UPI0008D12831|nr:MULTISPECIES: 3-ketoacyl-ACP reductase [unclassified Variovorax]SEK17347.1 NAD(P)-dependent dehydrogenase, short-chain alcohol dehydrogenase family [Variovorax sp. OK202]SFE80456.1 NAD(P)-dependent dehydrogenase, short-chain alcohol dehydrogenase family [Variovorax sp. OK212]
MDHPRAVALITGARRGIGRGIAYALAEAGFDLLLNDIENDAALQETLNGVKHRGREAKVVIADISDIGGLESLANQAWSAFGRIDHLINNAGVSVQNRGDLLDVAIESYNQNLDINLRGPFFLTQHIARRMLRASSNSYRSVVFISSISAATASLSRGEYCLSKAGVSMAAKLYALRLAEAGIGVHEVRPGIIRTDMTAISASVFDEKIANGISPLRRWGTPEDIGRAVAALCVGTFSFSTGGAFEVGGGIHLKSL